MKIETLLHEEIQDEFKNLKEMELGTEEYKTTVDGLAKLVDRAIEIDKLICNFLQKILSESMCSFICKYLSFLICVMRL